MSEKRRSFTQLKNSMTLKEFETFCRRIATQYAKFEEQYSASYFVKAENITKGCFYKILYEAIIRNLVSEELVNMMETKSICNQKKHALNAGETTRQHYARLRKERNEYIICSYTDLEIKQIAEDFTKSLEEKKTDFAKRYGIGITVLDSLLKKAFVENIADDEICKKIEKRSLSKDSSKRAKEFFAYLWKERNNKKKCL